jgi:hypothetical protein
MTHGTIKSSAIVALCLPYGNAAILDKQKPITQESARKKQRERELESHRTVS